MVVNGISFGNIAFVSAGGNHSLIRDFHNRRRHALLFKRHLDSDPVTFAVWFRTQAQHIAAQIDGSLRNAQFI